MTQTTADVAVQPDMLFRHKPCFIIDKKGLREYTRSGKLPEKIEQYRKEAKEKFYIRHGSHLNFAIYPEKS